MIKNARQYRYRFQESDIGRYVVEIISLEITLILQPARSDVKIGEAHEHGNRLQY